MVLHRNKSEIIVQYDSIKTTHHPPIIYKNFTCETWQSLPYIKASDYSACLHTWSDGSFWSVEGIRHTAHKDRLNSSSLIVEIGGNRGHDTVKFVELYDPWIISYEPLLDMWENLTKLFKSNSKIEFQPFGLGSRARNITVEPYDSGNAGTSVFRPLPLNNSTRTVQIELLNVVEVIQKLRRTRTKDGMIDLLTINCEGCEFEVLPALIVNNLTQYFRNIQFASHLNLVANTHCIYCQIEFSLEQTHKVNYHYNLLWEGWILK